VFMRKTTDQLYTSFSLFWKLKCIIFATMFQQLYYNRHNHLCGLLCQNQVSSSTTREQISNKKLLQGFYVQLQIMSQPMLHSSPQISLSYLLILCWCNIGIASVWTSEWHKESSYVAIVISRLLVRSTIAI
jgi:hypothetical protein